MFYIHKSNLFFILLFSMIINTSEHTKNITQTVEDYYTIYINNQLLDVARISDPGLLLHEANSYYHNQPAHNHSWLAYLFNARVNAQKIRAYWQSDPESAQWPLISVMCDLKDQARKLDYIAHWVQEQKEISDVVPNTQKLEKKITNQSKLFAQAIALIENRNESSSFQRAIAGQGRQVPQSTKRESLKNKKTVQFANGTK
jgi:hypothetical protein